MRVSIITVSYNSAATIEKTINSVLSQDYDNIEYILIDGNSTDGTVDIIKKYQDRIAYWISEPDGGLYEAMNKGIMRASGDIVGIINSDDFYEAGIIKKVVEVFELTKADIIYGRTRLLYDNGFTAISRQEPLENLNYKMVIAHPSVFVKQELYHLYGMFDCKYRIVADYDLMLRYYLLGLKFEFLDLVVANYSMEGISSQNSFLTSEEARVVALSHMDSEEKKNIYLPLLEEKCERFKVKREKWERNRDNIEGIKKKLDTFINGSEEIYIWGFGIWSVECYKILLLCNITIKGYVDTRKNQGEFLENSTVYPTSILEQGKKKVIVSSVKYKDEIFRELDSMGYIYEKDYIALQDFYEV